jgi:rhodanese-related sulfurtransferase
MSTYDPSKVDLSPEEFADHIQNTPDAIILDVRTPEEYDSGHLPGAINIDINGFDFLEQVENLDPSRPYFVYCKMGGRSARACLTMHEQGFANLHNLKGGILAWHGDTE